MRRRGEVDELIFALIDRRRREEQDAGRDLLDLFLAASMVAKYTAPGLTKWLLSRILAGETGTVVPVQAP